MDKDRILILNIADELGTHNLSVKDFTVKCTNCKKERSLYKDDIDKKMLKLKKCECGGSNKLDYWLDGIYTEEEYKQLILNSK